MAEPEPQPQHSTPTVTEPEPEPLRYWCYHCEKRVSIEPQTNESESEIICYECKNGFVESIPTAAPLEQLPSAANGNQERSFSDQFFQVLRLLAQAARDEDAPPPPPADDSEPDDFLRIELDGWHNDDEEDEIEFGNNEADRSENDVGDQEDEDSDADEGDRRRRQRRSDILRLQIRDFASRAATRRNRILDWSEILMGLEENAIELRVEMRDSDGYIGNPEDYVDAAGYDALLQNLAESEVGARRGAPPAAKSAVLGLKSVEVTVEEVVVICAICKEAVAVGNTAKELPCGHGYHGECIEQWLGSRNSCPVCRFELPTDDPDYEEERKKRSATGSDHSGSSNSGENSSVSG